MEKIIDGILTLVSVSMIGFGGQYTLHQVLDWSRHVALEKAAQGLAKLESTTQKMTGGKLDF